MECGKWSEVCVGCGVDSRVKCREWRVPEWSVEWTLGCGVNNGEIEVVCGELSMKSEGESEWKVKYRIEWRVESGEGIEWRADQWRTESGVSSRVFCVSCRV